ncbi:MAG: hypothetical protein ACI9OJ_000987 [Myxococcota bacterium]|jgi:hypothetical protein
MVARHIAQHVLQRLGEGGQPPDQGVLNINVGNESYLSVLRREYFENLLRLGASFKRVQGYFGGGKTHFLLWCGFGRFRFPSTSPARTWKRVRRRTNALGCSRVANLRFVVAGVKGRQR